MEIRFGNAFGHPTNFYYHGPYRCMDTKGNDDKIYGKRCWTKRRTFSVFAGAFSSGPLYAAFPIAGMLIKKGASLVNVFLFLGAWSTTKIPMMLFEATQLGNKFTGIRFILNMIGIIVIAFIIDKSTSQHEREELYQRISKISQK